MAGARPLRGDGGAAGGERTLGTRARASPAHPPSPARREAKECYKGAARRVRGMAGKAATRYGQLRNWLERIGIFGPAVLLTIVAFVVAYHFVQPAPPRHIVMATGS